MHERLSRRILARHLAREPGNVHPCGIDANLAKYSGHDRPCLCQHIGRHLRIVVDDDAHWQPLVLGPGRLGCSSQSATAIVPARTVRSLNAMFVAS